MQLILKSSTTLNLEAMASAFFSLIDSIGETFEGVVENAWALERKESSRFTRQHRDPGFGVDG